MRKEIKLAALAAIGALLACSCVKEITEEPKQYTPEEGAVSFVMEGISTRTSSPVQTITHVLGYDDNGNKYALLETVTMMDGYVPEAPATRGTPVYTENVESVYNGTFNGVITGSTGNVIAGDDAFNLMNAGGPWRRMIGYNPWAQSDPLTFFLRMPATATGVENLEYGFENNAGKIEFDYTTPATAAEQQDILFATRTISEETYMSEFSTNGGANVLFRHALTGVKFAIGNNTTEPGTRHPAGEVQTFIKKVEITGLKDKGHAKFCPDNTSETNNDNINVFSSAGSFTWSDVDGSSTETVYRQEFTEENIINYAKGENDAVGGADSFYAAGQNHNLNNANASLTFWFIPQEITADVKITVTFYVWNGISTGEDVVLDFNLGAALLGQGDEDNPGINVEWKPGQLRTFTLKPTTVDVDITDEVENNTTKKNVVITNTGNKEAYIRVAIVGNWVDKTTGDILAPWDETQGTFTGLGIADKWVKNETDGFWYYIGTNEPEDTPAVVKPGKTTYPLFTEYTKPDPLPEGVPADAGLVMDLVVQAIDLATATTYAEAWEVARNSE